MNHPPISDSAKAAVDRAIIIAVLPECYAIIDQLLANPHAPKDLVVRARRILPRQYVHSFEAKKA